MSLRAAEAAAASTAKADRLVTAAAPVRISCLFSLAIDSLCVPRNATPRPYPHVAWPRLAVVVSVLLDQTKRKESWRLVEVISWLPILLSRTSCAGSSRSAKTNSLVERLSLQFSKVLKRERERESNERRQLFD